MCVLLKVLKMVEAANTAPRLCVWQSCKKHVQLQRRPTLTPGRATHQVRVQINFFFIALEFVAAVEMNGKVGRHVSAVHVNELHKGLAAAEAAKPSPRKGNPPGEQEWL